MIKIHSSIVIMVTMMMDFKVYCLSNVFNKIITYCCTGLVISASCDAMLEEEEPRTMLKVRVVVLVTFFGGGQLSCFGYSLFMEELSYDLYQDSGFEDQCAKLNGHPGRWFSRSQRMLSFIEN